MEQKRNIRQSFAPSKDRQKSFYDLPAELRNHIYSLVLVRNPYDSEQTTLSKDHPGKGLKIWLDDHVPQPSLALVSKRVRKEALSIYFRQNIFSIWFDSYFQRPDLALHPRTKKWLARLDQDVVQIERLEVTATYRNTPLRWNIEIAQDKMRMKQAKIKIGGVLVGPQHSLREIEHGRRTMGILKVVLDMMTSANGNGCLGLPELEIIRRLLEVLGYTRIPSGC